MASPIILPQELKSLLDQQADIQLIDVRTSDKHAHFNIGGSNIPYELLMEQAGQLDRDKLIVTYCTSGNRSMRALELLNHLGFNNVKSLHGGVTAWQELSL
jgi:rhodanese-related sulfurtransferase